MQVPRDLYPVNLEKSDFLFPASPRSPIYLLFPSRPDPEIPPRLTLVPQLEIIPVDNLRRIPRLPGPQHFVPDLGQPVRTRLSVANDNGRVGRRPSITIHLRDRVGARGVDRGYPPGRV